MSRKSRRHSWPEAKKLCRLNRQDIEMARRLGFTPDALIRAIPSPKQKWKLPVREWVHCLYQERFGQTLAEEPVAHTPIELEDSDEAARRFGEQLYWEDYWERNADTTSEKTAKKTTRPLHRNPKRGRDTSLSTETV